MISLRDLILETVKKFGEAEFTTVIYEIRMDFPFTIKEIKAEVLEMLLRKEIFIRERKLSLNDR